MTTAALALQLHANRSSINRNSYTLSWWHVHVRAALPVSGWCLLAAKQLLQVINQLFKRAVERLSSHGQHVLQQYPRPISGSRHWHTPALAETPR